MVTKQGLTNKEKQQLKDIGERFADLRREKGLSIKQFCIKNKLPEIQYWRIEHGRANLTFKSINRILSIHKTSWGDFFNDVYKDKAPGRSI